MASKTRIKDRDEELETEKGSDNFRELPKTDSTLEIFDGLDNKEKALVDAVVQNSAATNRELAKMLGKSERSIYTYLQRPEIKKCIEGLQKKDLNLFLECRREAIIVNRDIMIHGEVERNRVRAAQQFLKGMVPDRIVIEDNADYDLTEEDERGIEKKLGIIGVTIRKRPSADL